MKELRDDDDDDDGGDDGGRDLDAGRTGHHVGPRVGAWNKNNKTLGGPVANAINVIQACIYKSEKQGYFQNHLWPQVVSNSKLSCSSAKELGV